jgi:hypothetical protein
VLKGLWAPLVDRFGWGRLGHYRGWLIVLPARLLQRARITSEQKPLDIHTSFIMRSPDDPGTRAIGLPLDTSTDVVYGEELMVLPYR